MAQWFVRGKKTDIKEIAKRHGIDPVTAWILENRGIQEEEMDRFLHPSLADLHDPELMKDLEPAAEFVYQAAKDGKKIRVFGDYDADGIFSTYILVNGLSAIGGNVSWQIPDRIKDGYGLNPSMIKKAHEDDIEVVITCDNGISAREAVRKAKGYGMSVVVTDHHELPFDIDSPDTLPMEDAQDLLASGKRYHIPIADYVVDPHRPDDDYPYEEICGAVVAFKFIQEVYRKAATEHMNDITENTYLKYLPEAAFATVTDVMDLRDENRSIVFLGLRKLAADDPSCRNTGLNALIEKSGIDRTRLDTFHIGFVLGPAFNASGRLASADIGEDLLLEEDLEKADKLAQQLFDLNTRRKGMTEEGEKTAEKMLEIRGPIDKVIVLSISGLHPSLCGLIAGRLKEKYHRPAFVFSDDGGEYLKGSGRSIEGYSMYVKLVAAEHTFEKERPGEKLFVGYGGHPMAAGLTIKKDLLGWFKSFINKDCGLEDKDFEEKMIIDVPMPLWYVTERLIDEINRLAPFGKSNEKPLFAEKGLRVLSYRKIGKEKQYRKLTLISKDKYIDAVSFGDGDEMDKIITDAFGSSELDAALNGKPNDICIDVAYYPEINEYMGYRNVQAMIQGIKARQMCKNII